VSSVFLTFEASDCMERALLGILWRNTHFGREFVTNEHLLRLWLRKTAKIVITIELWGRSSQLQRICLEIWLSSDQYDSKRGTGSHWHVLYHQERIKRFKPKKLTAQHPLQHKLALIFQVRVRMTIWSVLQYVKSCATGIWNILMVRQMYAYLLK